ncbi:MAG: DMT family transporter [Sheuella sp.]|nr:DMT family transporter [Sheuella sp.]
MNKQTHPLYGILLISLSSLLFATHDNISKYLTLLYPPILVVWARFMTQSVLMVGVFAPRMGLDLIRSNQLLLQLARGACMMVASMSFVLSLHFNVPVGEATAVVFLSPLLVTWFSGRVLKEKINRGQWVAIGCGLLGVLVIVRPGSALFTAPILFPFVSSIAVGAFQLLTRQLVKTDNIIATNFMTGLFCTVVMSLVVAYSWQTPTVIDAMLMISGGAIAMVGHVLLTYAYRQASVVTLAPFSYAQIIFAALVAFLFFGHMPDQTTLVGMLIIIASGVGLILWQRR